MSDAIAATILWVHTMKRHRILARFLEDTLRIACVRVCPCLLEQEEDFTAIHVAPA